jgi:hypothetical protein
MKKEYWMTTQSSTTPSIVIAAMASESGKFGESTSFNTLLSPLLFLM